MKRNKQTERLKRLHKMNSDLNNAYARKRNMEWVPVEEPQFLGWELTLDLQEGAKLRRDAHKLVHVLDLLSAKKPVTTTKESVVKLIRSQGRNYRRSLEAYKNKYRRRSWWNDQWITEYRHFPLFFDRTIEVSEWEKQTQEIQKYFIKGRRNYWTPESERNTVYRLDAVEFPTYELVIKIERAYSTHRGIPDGEAHSESEYLHDVLMQEHYWCRKNNFDSKCTWEVFEHKRNNRVRRKAWNMATKVIAKHFNEEDSLEVVEQQETKVIGRSSFTWR